MRQKIQEQSNFKNIELRSYPTKSLSPDSHNPHAQQPSFSPTNRSPNRQDQPQSFHKQFNLPSQSHHASNLVRKQQIRQKWKGGFQRVTIERQLLPGEEVAVETSYQQSFDRSENRIVLKESRIFGEGLVLKLQQEIQEKEEIIAELKNIIRLSHENSMKNKTKTIHFQQKSPKNTNNTDEIHKQIKELRHNVKILTIENSTLSDYIQKQSQKHFSLKPNQQQNALNQDQSYVDKLLKQKERFYQQKIDEFISSHKSLAQECQRLQQQKANLQSQNQKLIFLLKESQDSQRKLVKDDERITKSSGEKFSIQKIKEQYNISLKQFKQTVYYQILHLFEDFKIKFEAISKTVDTLESRLIKLQGFIGDNHFVSPANIKKEVKKQEIYIQQGVDSQVSEKDSKYKDSRSGENQEPAQSKEEEAMFQDNELIDLQEQIIRLKQIINELEIQLSKRSDEYTFRSKQFQSCRDELSEYQVLISQKKQVISNMKIQKETLEKEMLVQIERLKSDINTLQSAYERQRFKVREQNSFQLYKKDQRITQLQTGMAKLAETYELELRRYESAKIYQKCYEENIILKKQLNDCIQKIQNYNQILLLMRQSYGTNSIDFSVFANLKTKIQHLQHAYNQNLQKHSALQAQRSQMINTINQLQSKIEDSQNKSKTALEQIQRGREKIRKMQLQKAQMAHKVAYLENVNRVYQQQLKQKKQMQKAILQQNSSLQQQILKHLNTRKQPKQQESQERWKQFEKFDFSQVVNELGQLQDSVSKLITSQSSKKQQIQDLISKRMQQSQHYDVQFKEDS